MVQGVKVITQRRFPHDGGGGEEKKIVNKTEHWVYFSKGAAGAS